MSKKAESHLRLLGVQGPFQHLDLLCNCRLHLRLIGLLLRSPHLEFFP